MQQQVASLIEKLDWEHKEDIKRCAQSGSTPVRIRMWKDLSSMGVVEMLPGKALDGWVLTEFGKAVAHEVLEAKYAGSNPPHIPQ